MRLVNYLVACTLIAAACIVSGCGTTRNDIAKGMQTGGAGSMGNLLGGVVYAAGVLVAIGADEGDGYKKLDNGKKEPLMWGAAHECIFSSGLRSKIKELRDAGMEEHIPLALLAYEACDQAVTKRFNLEPKEIEDIRYKYESSIIPWVSVPVKSQFCEISLVLHCRKSVKN